MRKYMSLIFKQFKDNISATYTYIAGNSNTKEVVIIDSVMENILDYVNFLNENSLNLKYIIETHVHADHITGIKQLKKYFPQAEILISKHAAIQYEATRISDQDKIMLGDIPIQFFETTGHTNDSISILIAQNRLCTGDCLFIGSCGRTDFQNGSNHDMFHSLRKISNLPEDTLIYPGHDYQNRYVSNIKEELLQNKMIKLLDSYENFCAELNSWNLPPPKKIKESVPANLNGGFE